MRELDGKFKKSMVAIIQNTTLKFLELCACGFVPRNYGADSLMQPIGSLHLSFAGFVSYLKVSVLAREGCEETVVTFVGRNNTALPNISETDQAPLSRSRRGKNSGRKNVHAP